jgi:hypothetical protein
MALPVNWSYNLVGVWDGDPTGTQILLASGLTASGTIPSNGTDGITTPHTLSIPTPQTTQGITIYAPGCGVVALKAGHGTPIYRTYQNSIVPGITPSVHVVIPGVTQTVKGSAVQASTGLGVDSSGNLKVNITGPLYTDVNNNLNLLTATGPLYINSSNELV